MGWYIRKSVSFGPLRLNLSKSGIGYSVGVKGARIGTGPKGSYVHLGRGGVYYRESLGGRTPPAGSESVQPPPPVERFCNACGNRLSPIARFCNQCGTQITEEAAAANDGHVHWGWIIGAIVLLVVVLRFVI